MTREQKLDALLRLFDAYLEAAAKSPMAKENGHTHWIPSRPIEPTNETTLGNCIFLGRPGTIGFNDEDWIELP